jgi:hypothetical protein
VKDLKITKLLIIAFIPVIFSLGVAQSLAAQSPNELKTYFSAEYAGISVVVAATNETVPLGNITVYLWVNCTAEGVRIDHLNFSFYGFRGGQVRTLLSAVDALSNESLPLNGTRERFFTVPVPSDVWDAAYCEFSLRYSIKNSSLEWNPSFPITIVRNVSFEALEEHFGRLFSKLMDQFKKFEQLNQTYTELQNNYTSLKDSVNAYNSATQVAIVLGVTTVFFLGTTVYLVMRRPKDYW